MKKFFTLLTVLLIFSISSSVAQDHTKESKKGTSKTEMSKKATQEQKAAPSSAKTTMHKAEQKSMSDTDGKHLKKDGTPDKRYKENKAQQPKEEHLTKSGKPDMRYKENKEK